MISIHTNKYNIFPTYQFIPVHIILPLHTNTYNTILHDAEVNINTDNTSQCRPILTLLVRLTHTRNTKYSEIHVYQDVQYILDIFFTLHSSAIQHIPIHAMHANTKIC